MLGVLSYIDTYFYCRGAAYLHGRSRKVMQTERNT